MTAFVAHDLGYTKQLNCTFSHSGYMDQTIPQEMAAFLKHEWIFKALDNGIWLYDVDEVTYTTGGNVLYYGTAHGNSLLKYINFDHLGLMHSGQLGDVVVSSKTNINDKNDVYSLGDGAYSLRFLDSLTLSSAMRTMNKEMGFYYYRFLNGTNNGLQNVYNYTESLSPFMDLDFIEYCLHIPVAMRQNHTLYKKWIISRYPQAAQFVWEAIGCRIDSKIIKIAGKECHLAMIPNIIKVRLGLKRNGLDSQNHMNPVGYYITHNKDLWEYLSGYFKYAEFIEDIEIRDMVESIIKDGTAMEKIQIVTVLSAIKMFFINDSN